MARGNSHGGGRGGFSAGFQDIASRFSLVDVDEVQAKRMEEKANKPSDTFPPFNLPVARPPSDKEREAVHYYRLVRARIRDGPHYCNLDPAAKEYKSNLERGGRARTPPAAHFDAFGGQDTYTQRFRKKRNLLPDLTTRPYHKEYFPRELWKTMGVEEDGDENAESRPRKRLKISKVRLDKWEQYHERIEQEAEKEEEEPPEEEEKPERVYDADKDDDDDVEQEDADPDQLSDDDDDDYNAEQYFQAGDEDDAGDEGGNDDGDF